jgi:integrase
MAKRLSATFVAHAKPGRHGDGDGLYLQVRPSGSKSWVLRYQYQREKGWMGLGSARFVSLAEAREKAFEAHRQLRQGINPLEARTADKAERRASEAKRVSFAECAARFVADRGSEWRSAKHRRDWLGVFGRYAFPVFGDLPVAAIDTPLVLRVLEPIWLDKAGTARKLRQRLEAVLDWARVRGYRDGENPARLGGHLDHLLPKRSKATTPHHAALPYADVPAFMAELRERDGIPARALEFLILTAARAGEVRGALWAEIDFQAKTWTVPGSRMKGGREHRVPLSPRALELLSTLPRTDDLVFPDRKGGPMYANAVYYVLREGLGRGEITVHGFRSTFRDWTEERTNYPREVAEQALAHSIGTAVERAYRRTDLFERRRQLMTEWASFCSGSTAVTGDVVPMRGRA